MTMLASQITSLTVVYSTVYSGVHQRKHQSSASLAFVREIHRGPVNFPHKWPVTRKMFPFDDVIMRPSYLYHKKFQTWMDGLYAETRAESYPCSAIIIDVFSALYICSILVSVYHRCVSHRKWSGPGPRFNNVFSIAIQIRWKLCFTLTSILIQWSLQNFVHGTTAVLSWHVQKFVAIGWPVTELQQDEVSIEFELRAKNR